MNNDDICEVCPTCKEFRRNDDPKARGCWPKCSKKHDMVHIEECHSVECKNPIAILMDDEYCGPEILLCSDCVRKLLL